MTDKLVVLNTCASLDEARKVARALVDARLAACVNVLPSIQSIYRWKGEVEEATECLLVIKTRAELLPSLEAEIRRVHSYELAEVIALSVAGGLPEYLGWIDSETGAGGRLA